MSAYQKWILTSLFTASTSLLLADQPSAQNTSSSKPATPPSMQVQITPPAGPRTDTGARFLLTADFIYW